MTSGEGTGGTTLVAPSGKNGLCEQRTLRSSRHSKSDAGSGSAVAKLETEPTDSAEEDRALLLAEETMLMDGDEEIESSDENGKPIVDAEQVERRMMTVALVQSVVETSGQAPSKGKDAAALRARVEKSLTKKSKEKVDVTKEEAQPHSYGLRRRKRGEGDSDVSKSPPASPRSPRMRRGRRSDSAVKVAPTRATQVIDKGESNVPNPLLQPHGNGAGNQTAPIGDSSDKQRTCDGDSDRNQPLPSSVLNVPCPLPATTVNCEPKSIHAPAADLVGPSTTRRGRIFSIDIDPEGFEFPDMSIENTLDSHIFDATAQAQGGTSATGLNPRTFSLSSDPRGQRKASTGSGSAMLNDVPFPTQGRDRAMSFEFFSFGINADEPLPDVKSSDQVMTRPRGNSIIFDPVSFQDGGIHEEKLFAKTRTSSLDLVDAAVPLATAAPYGQTGHGGPSYLMNDQPSSSRSPSNPSRQQLISSSYQRGDGSSSALKSGVPSNKLTASDMATLPSSLANSHGNSSNTSLQHTTFQMELLNKDGRIGIYLPDARRARIAKFHSKRKMRIWRKRIKYDCRKKLADSRPRIKGRFVKRSDVDEE